MTKGKYLVRRGNVIVVLYPHLFLECLVAFYRYPLILFMITHSCFIKVGICFYIKCVDHRLVQDLGSSPGTLSGCALVRTHGPSHEKIMGNSVGVWVWSYGKPKRDCISEYICIHAFHWLWSCYFWWNVYIWYSVWFCGILCLYLLSFGS